MNEPYGLLKEGERMKWNLFLLVLGLIFAFISKEIPIWAPQWTWVGQLLVYLASATLILALLLSMPIYTDMLYQKKSRNKALFIGLLSMTTFVSFQFSMVHATEQDWLLSGSGGIVFFLAGSGLIRLISVPKSAYEKQEKM